MIGSKNPDRIKPSQKNNAHNTHMQIITCITKYSIVAVMRLLGQRPFHRIVCFMVDHLLDSLNI